MKSPALALNEKERLQILDDSGLVFSPAEERFDRITRLARRIFDVPIALVSLVTANTQWFKSSQGLTVCETSREISFCGHAILRDETFIIPDALKDPDFADNPLVVNAPHIRFYAGHPIRFNSVNLGTTCIIDQRPRRFGQADFDALKSLALWIENEMKLSLYTASQKELLQKVSILERKSLVDSVTGCWNQKGMDILVKRELSIAHMNKQPVSMLLVDVGNSLKIKGRQVSNKMADIIMKEIAQRIRATARSVDIVGKLVNNQFLVYLTDCDTDMCRKFAQRILSGIVIERMKTENNYIPLSALIGSTSNAGTDIWSSTILQDTLQRALKLARNVKTPNNYFYLEPEIDASQI